MARRKKGTINTVERYFHGIAPLVAKATGYSFIYVGDVLRGHYDDRDTEAVRKIKETADLFMIPVNNPEIVEAV